MGISGGHCIGRSRGRKGEASQDRPKKTLSTREFSAASCAALSLKPGPPGADGVCMFIRIKEAPPARGARLRCLRLALNTPVVAIDGLLVGPAAACIVVHGRAGALGLVLALRSVRSGQLAFFAPEAASPLADVELAIEAAAGFAEAMGFLFDEDWVADARDPRAVERRWREFLAEPEFPEPALAQMQHSGVLSKFRFERAPSPRVEHRGASRPRRFVRG